jgi:phosphoribosyl-ATP pyrophosphohydrolase
MKTPRIPHRARKSAQWSVSTRIPAVRLSSSNNINGKFADHLKILHPRSHQPGESGDLIGLANGASAAVLEDLSRSLGSVTASAHPRTFKLLQSGRRKLARKLIEEACEVTVEAVKRDIDGVVRESADLLYHLIVLWFQMDIRPDAVWQEMQRRADTLGIAEKLPKASPDNDPFAPSGR